MEFEWASREREVMHAYVIYLIYSSNSRTIYLAYAPGLPSGESIHSIDSSLLCSLIFARLSRIFQAVHFQTIYDVCKYWEGERLKTSGGYEQLPEFKLRFY